MPSSQLRDLGALGSLSLSLLPKLSVYGVQHATFRCIYPSTLDLICLDTTLFNS